MPNITITNISGSPVNLRDLYLNLDPGKTASVFRSSAQLMSMADLHHEIAFGTITFGMVYTPDEVASGFAPFPSTMPAYGELWESNDSGSSISIASAGTFYRWTTTTVGVLKGAPLVLGDAATDVLTIGPNGGGVYTVNGTAVFDGGNNIDFAWAVHANGAILNNIRTASAVPSGSAERATCSASGLAVLNPGDTVDWRVTASSGGSTCVLYRANLNIVRVEAA